MTIGIYCIENLVNGKKYVGKSISVEKRWSRHKSLLCNQIRNKRETNIHLWNSVQEYGWDNFKCYILEEISTIDETYMSVRELFWMDAYNTCNRDFGYNLRRDSSTGLIVSDETRYRMSASSKGRLHLQTTKDKISLAKLGIPRPQHVKDMIKYHAQNRSSETRAKISKSLTGKHPSDETRAKMSESSKRENLSAETRLKLSLAGMGRSHSDETKRKMSESQSGDKHPMFGHSYSDEYKKNMSYSCSKYAYEQYVLTGELVKTFFSLYDCKEAGFNPKLVSSACNGTQKTHKGFLWKKVYKYGQTLDTQE